ncbi:DUF1109 domain-containing protein [Paraburkholderia bengalensis]|uniref:DUF1109 domain-containing protein n=1 Tax=Paraburkholderia bengalensis TaxID=2747562 RepID=A0ABU8J0Q2_9BURK
MKTDTLISLLASDVDPVDRCVAGRRFARALVFAVAGSFCLVTLCCGLRPDISEMLVTPLFWAKMAFPATLAGFALIASARLSCPGIALGYSAILLAAALAIVLLWGAVLLWATPSDNRVPVLLGRTWRTCALNIALVSGPSFFALVRTVQSLAPTRLRLAGAATGLLSGATGAVVYCLHCPEMSPAFWALWYVVGMGLSAALGALLGPRLLHW